MALRIFALLIVVTATSAANFVSLTDGTVRCDVALVDGQLTESFWVLASGGWTLAATSRGSTRGSLSLHRAESFDETVEVDSVRRTGNRIVEEIHGGDWKIEKFIDASGTLKGFRVAETISPAHSLRLHSFFDSYVSTLTPDWAFSPSVGGFNPDSTYKAPLILIQRQNSAVGIVPDVLSLDRESLLLCNHVLDLGLDPHPALSVGFIPARREYHTVFKEDLDKTWTIARPLVNSYYIYLTGHSAAREAYQDIVRFHWNQFGRPAQSHAAIEQTGTDRKYADCHLWDEWRKVVWEQESLHSWLKLPLPDGTVGGAVGMNRADSPKPSVYLSAWFNSLRTAYGMALYARRIKNSGLLQLAQQTVNLAVKAPGKGGAFKCFAVLADPGSNQPAAQVTWGAGDGAGTSVRSGYLGFDMSWTGYWLLRWFEAGLPGSDTIIARCIGIADFLITHQRPDGSLPTRFDEDGQVEEDLSRTVAAETAPVARFLFELYKISHDRKYFSAAIKALDFLDREIVPSRKWYDFETFWSCSPRVINFDARTHQWPANDLALIHAVAAYLQAYGLTGEQRYLLKGQSLLDYLLLYQQIWTNPVLKGLTSSVMLLGGFTTQNSDEEWSDARQSLAGEVILNYYRATHEVEYLERGVAALRSQFPVSPSENWAHEGYGGKAGVSSFHWGTGSGMAGIEIEQDYLGDVVCDVHAVRCVGVNGLDVRHTQVTNDGEIDLRIGSPYHWPRSPEIVFHGVQPERLYGLSINGSESRKWLGKQLERGVALERSPIPEQPPSIDGQRSK